MMSPDPRYALVNSTLGFVSAFILTTVIHECGHYLSYLFFGAHPILHHNYVAVLDPQLSVPVRVISALAGPVISLLQGALACALVLLRKRNTAGDLLLLWLGLLGLVNFFGYLMLTPLSAVGDTGRVAALLEIPFAGRIIIAAVGIGLLVLAVLRMGREFARFIPPGLDLSGRRKYVNILLVFPIIVGSIVNAMLALPVVSVLSIVYPATSPYVIMSSYRKALNAVALNTKDSPVLVKLSMFLVGLTVAGILLNRLLV